VRNELRILILDDVATDAVRINHELRRGGLSFVSKRVERKEDFLRELNQTPPDLILSDQGLPSFDGFTALAVAKDTCPTVPFIFVSGAHGEQIAIETFKSGATDYVLKDHLSELVPAVQRALRETEDRRWREQAERSLRESEERFRMLVDGVKDYALFMLDPEGRVTSWNPGAQRLHGYHPDEVLGRPVSLFYVEEDTAKSKPTLDLRTAAVTGRFEEEGRRARKCGKKFGAHVVITALRDLTGKLRGYAHVTRDISGRRQMQDSLHKSEALKTAILDAALDAIISIDQAGRLQEWNRAAEKIFGYSRDDALGRPVDQLIIPPTLRKLYHDGVAHYLMTGAASLVGKPIELTLRRADGSEFRAEMGISRILTESPPRCTALIRDITERKQAEMALRRSEERLRMLVDGVKDYAIYLLDEKGNVTTWNAGAERLTGYREEEILGKPLATLFTPEDADAGMPAGMLQRAAKEGHAQYNGWRLRKDGSRFWAEGEVTVLKDEAGQVRGFSKVAHDVSRQREAEEAIQRLNATLEQRVRERTAQLEEANQELEAFSYSVSHDLRAPLLHISGYADILLSEAGAQLDRQSKDYLKVIAEGAKQMGGLIDALLEFSRMGRSELRKQRVDVAALVEEARRTLRRELENRNVEWAVAKLPEVRGDPTMLKQVLVNLLSNALKYTRSRARPKIKVGATLGSQEAVFFVRDNGVGFDMDFSGKLFGVFQRLHPAREFEGTGIGLANVRRIIHRHGGRVWAEGAVNKGATFYFSLPTAGNGGTNDTHKMDSVG
jgi:PAS domain S-box-containing protein